MDNDMMAAEARRLGAPVIASAIDEHGSVVLSESTVAVDHLIQVFDQRLRRAQRRDDRPVVQLVSTLLTGFRSAESTELKMTHIKAGQAEAMFYGETDNESVLAIVILSEHGDREGDSS